MRGDERIMQFSDPVISLKTITSFITGCFHWVLKKSKSTMYMPSTFQNKPRIRAVFEGFLWQKIYSC